MSGVGLGKLLVAVVKQGLGAADGQVCPQWLW